MSLSLPDSDCMLDFANRGVHEAWTAAWTILRNHPSSDGLGAMLPHGNVHSARSPLTAMIVWRAGAALPRLVRFTRGMDVTGSLAVALPLIGGGPGLTPSWDDLLIGFLCGLRASGGNHEAKSRFVGHFGIAVAEASAGTTAVSRAYICRTVKGTGPEWIESALAAIRAGDPTRTRAATARALRVGHTSGADMMLGAILGSSVWQDGREADEMLSALSCENSACSPMSDGNGRSAMTYPPI